VEQAETGWPVYQVSYCVCHRPSAVEAVGRPSLSEKWVAAHAVIEACQQPGHKLGSLDRNLIIGVLFGFCLTLFDMMLTCKPARNTFFRSQRPPSRSRIARTGIMLTPPTESDKGEITLLLDRLATGDRSAEEALMSRVYFELHKLAIARLKAERPGHTLQPTALVHEAYLRLCRSRETSFQNRAHFFRLSARIMRRILVDYARQRGAQKRKDAVCKVSLDNAITVSAPQAVEALEINELLNRLAEFSPRQAQVVEMRFYGGLSEEEIAAAFGVHVRTIRRDWLMARAWLHQQLSPD
jgi:RNA polymerase sigma-70 factor, ECF subfamily